MDMEEIRYLLGGTIFARAKAYTDLQVQVFQIGF